MDVRHRIPFLLVARLVQLPLVNVVKLTAKIDFVVLDYLLDPVRGVTHEVKELMVEQVGL